MAELGADIDPLLLFANADLPIDIRLYRLFWYRCNALQRRQFQDPFLVEESITVGQALCILLPPVADDPSVTTDAPGSSFEPSSTFDNAFLSPAAIKLVERFLPTLFHLRYKYSGSMEDLESAISIRRKYLAEPGGDHLRPTEHNAL